MTCIKKNSLRSKETPMPTNLLTISKSEHHSNSLNSDRIKGVFSKDTPPHRFAMLKIFNGITPIVNDGKANIIAVSAFNHGP